MDTSPVTLNLRVLGSIPRRLTIRLPCGLPHAEPQARSWQANDMSNALSDHVLNTRVDGQPPAITYSRFTDRDFPRRMRGGCGWVRLIEPIDAPTPCVVRQPARVNPQSDRR